MDIVSQMVVDLLCDEKDTGKMVVNLSSDEEDSEKIVVDLSSDDEYENISWNFHSDLADKRKGADEMVSTTSRRHKTKGKRAESEVKKLELARIPGVSGVAAIPKDCRKKKTDELAIITWSPSRKSNEQKEVSVATYKKILRVHLTAFEHVPGAPLGSFMARLKSITFHTHTSLVGKKVILYGLPGYSHYDEYALWDLNKVDVAWREFYRSRLLPPALEFVEQADVLKANGVDQILFIAVNPTAMNCSLASTERGGWPGFVSRFPYVRILWDSKYHNPKLRSFYRGLRLGPDICEGWIPPRCRKYFFLLDDNKVIYSNIETSDQVFIPPSTEEIIKAFNG